MSLHVIYGLYDSTVKGKRIRYVGYTSKDQRKRLIAHICEAKAGKISHRHKWIRSLLRRGVEPEIKILEEVTEHNWKERETYWIKKFAKNKLTNGTTGGEGLINPTKRVRRAISKKVSISLIGNQRRLGIPHTEEAKRAMSWSQLNSPKVKAKNKRRKGKPGHPCSEETKAILSSQRKNVPRPRWLIEKWQAGAIEANKGSFWITNGKESTILRKGAKIPRGWVKGRTIKEESQEKMRASWQERIADGFQFSAERNSSIARTKTGGRWITNGLTSRFLLAAVVADVPRGWRYGRI